MKKLFIAIVFILFGAMVHAQNVGIGTPAPVAKLTIVGGSSSPAIPGATSTAVFRIGVAAAEGIDFGKMGSSPFSVWMQAGFNGNTTDPLSLQPLGGNVGIGIINPTANLHVNGAMKIEGINTLEFGAGVAGKENNAGKIGYNTFVPDALCIVGSGTSGLNRKLEIFAEGGTTFNGLVKITGGTPAAGKVLTSDATGLASWQNIGQHYIGESYGGGIVFYVYDNGQHGLIAATEDINNLQWYNGTYKYLGSGGDGLNAGAMNTTMIVAQQMADPGAASFPALRCANYSVTVGSITYGDWYLPSAYELNLLFLQKAVVGGFTAFSYWSSSEFSAAEAWYQYFPTGFQGFSSKGSTNFSRAIRAF